MDDDNVSAAPGVGWTINEIIHGGYCYYSDERDAILTTTLEKEIRAIIDAEAEVITHRIADTLPTFVCCFLHDDLATNVDLHWNTVHRRRLSRMVEALFTKFNAAQNNVVYVSVWLACIFRMMAEKSPVPAEEMKSKITAFVDTVEKLVKVIDGAMWTHWFSCDGLFADWFLFVATMFVPNAEDKSTVENAAKYFDIVKNRRYTCSSYRNCADVDIGEILNNCTDPLSKDICRKNKNKRKVEGCWCDVEEERPKRQRRKAKTGAAIDDEPSGTPGESTPRKPAAKKPMKRTKLFKKLLRKTIRANLCYQK